MGKRASWKARFWQWVTSHIVISDEEIERATKLLRDKVEMQNSRIVEQEHMILKLMDSVGTLERDRSYPQMMEQVTELSKAAERATSKWKKLESDLSASRAIMGDFNFKGNTVIVLATRHKETDQVWIIDSYFKSMHEARAVMKELEYRFSADRVMVDPPFWKGGFNEWNQEMGRK